MTPLTNGPLSFIYSTEWKSKSTYWLIHHAYHYVGEDAELEKETQFHPEIEGFQDIFLSEVWDQRHPFEAVCKECRQIVVELLIYQPQVMLEVCRERLDIIENLLEVFFDHCQDPGQLYVAQPWDDIVSYCVILVSDQDWEFDIESLHHGCGLTPDCWLFTQSYLPVRQQTFH